jgi:phosphotransferase system HPr (HPr) family protein
MMVSNETGLHARPVSELVRCAIRFRSEIQIVANGRTCSATSIMDLMSANITAGMEMLVTAEGKDADKALDALEQVLAGLATRGF